MSFNLKNAILIERKSNLLRQKCIETVLIVKLSTENLHPGS